MTDKDAFADRKRELGEEFFRRKEQEFIEKMRYRMRLEAERRELAETIGVPDEEILRTLQGLGYTRKTVALLHLVPLVQVAWADGRVSAREKGLIFEAARLRGIDEKHPAYSKLTGWLEERPPEEFFDRTLRVISAILEALPPEQAAASHQDLLTCCERVAEASDCLIGFVGFGSYISNAEQLLLERIVTELRLHHQAATN